MTTLTENEIKALQCCISQSSTAEYMKADPGSVMAGAPEMMKALGWNHKQVAALINSLEQKGMGFGDDNEGNGHIFWPSDAGYDAAYAALNKTTK